MEDALAPLRKTVLVPMEPPQAFELFTTRIARWWPLPTHSVGLADAVLVTFPQEVGGSILETMRDGTSCTWGTVTRWDPPSAVAFTWHPGQSESGAGDIDVSFTSDGIGGTVVALTHSGWARRSDGAAARRRYETGWDVVLAPYRSTASVRPARTDRAGRQLPVVGQVVQRLGHPGAHDPVAE
jgi:Activator of Hsp90 ATPase homolog 1-like protein